MGLLGNLGNPLRAGLVQLIVNDSTGQNTVIQFDASIRENHTRESPVSEFPIENGLAISDHVLVRPFSLELNGIITDSPIGTVQQLLTEVGGTLASSLLPPVAPAIGAAAYSLISSFQNSKSPSAKAYGDLLQLQANAQPFDVLTSLYRYSNMWIKRISVPRDAETGNALVFTLELVQLILVSPQSVNVKVFANPALSANQADLGSQAAGIPNGFKQGFTDTNTAINNVVKGGVAH